MWSERTELDLRRKDYNPASLRFASQRDAARRPATHRNVFFLGRREPMSTPRSATPRYATLRLASRRNATQRIFSGETRANVNASRRRAPLRSAAQRSAPHRVATHRNVFLTHKNHLNERN
jgi:hypothetical protein